MRTASVLFLLACAAIAQAADLSGEWLFRMGGPNGETVEAQLTLKVEDQRLTGSFVFPEGRKLEVQDGTVNGNTLKFVVKRERPQGGTATYKMAGSWEGGSIKGTAETDMFGQTAKAEWSASRK